MADSIKKETEVNELVTEAKDMELENQSGGAFTITKALKCGYVLTLSAECFPGHKSCNPFTK